MTLFPGTDLPPDILRAAAAGERQAFDAIYGHYRKPVYTLVRRLISRPAVADDLLQDVFVEILRSVGSYSGQGSFGGWVRAIAVSKCLMYLRSPWHRSLLWLDAEAPESPTAESLSCSAPPLESQAAAQADLERALSKLSPLTRTVVWLHDVEGYTHQDIAKVLGRSVAFSKSQLSRAHQRLRELLEPQTESLPCMPASTSY